MLLSLGRGLSSMGSAFSFKWFLSPSYQADGVSPSFFADFKNNRYATNTSEIGFSDILTFSRSTTGTYFDKNGAMQTSAINAPRFDYDPVTFVSKGILIEGQRANICRYSATPYADWSTVGSNKFSAPTNFLGFFNNGVIVSGTGATWNRVEIGGISWTSGTQYSWQAFCKAGTSGKIRIQMRDGAAGTESVVNGNIGAALTVLQNSAGTITYGGAKSVGGGYIYYGTFTPNSTITDGKFGVSPNSTVSGETVILYGAQLEAGPIPSSFITTTSTAVTRGADSLMNSSGNVVKFTDWYNQSEGTLLIDWHCDHIFQAGGRLLYAAYKASDQWNYRLFGEGAGAGPSLKHNSVSGGSFTASIGSAALSGNDFTDAFAYKTDDFSVYRDGVSLGTDASGAVPSGLDSLTIGGIATSNQFFGHIRELRYYPKRISNAELQRITT